MKNLKRFAQLNENDQLPSGKKLPTGERLYTMFDQINKDTVEIHGEDGFVTFEDEEFYVDQINNIFFNYVTGKDDFPTARKMYQSMVDYAKSKGVFTKGVFK